MKHNKTKLKFISIMILAIIVIVGIIAVAIKSSDIYADVHSESVANFNVVIDLHPKKALVPIVVTLFGITPPVVPLAIIVIVGIIAVAIKSSDIYAADPTYTDSGVTYL